MQKNYLKIKDGENILDSMVQAAAEKLAELTNQPVNDCFDDLNDYINSFDWMLIEEDDDGDDVIDLDYFNGKFMENAIDFCVSMSDN